ncbi:hypothetical protein D3C71_2067240 [compost metagenome]
MFKVPLFLSQKRIILSIDAKLLIKRDIHFFCGDQPIIRLFLSQTNLALQTFKMLRILLS